MNRRLPLALLIGAPLVCLLAGSAVGWFTDIGDNDTSSAPAKGEPLPAVFDVVAPLQPLAHALSPLDQDESAVIGAAPYLDAASAIDVPSAAELEIEVAVGASAVAVDPSTLEPSPPVVATPIPLGEASATNSVPNELSPAPMAVVRDAQAIDVAATPNQLRVSAPFAASGVFASLCDEVQAGNVPDPALSPAVRPTLAVFVNQPATIAVSGTWGDGALLEKSTMVTLPAHDDEWQRQFAETGEQRSIIACFALPIEDVRNHATAGVARLRASVLAIGASGQADLNATVVLNVPLVENDPLLVDAVTFAGRGEQRRADGRLYPTMHVHYAFLSDAVVPTGSTLLPAQVRVFGDHQFVEGADCAGWAANQQGIERTDSSRFSVATETRSIAGRDRTVTTVDGDLYLDPRLPGGWEGSLCVRLQATDLNGGQRSTLVLRGAQVRSPRTATYAVGVALNEATPPAGPMGVTWTSANGGGCTATTVLNGLGAQCEFSARWAPDGIVVRLTLDNANAVLRVPVNIAYCNPDDPLDSGNGCSTGFTHSYAIPFVNGQSVQVTLNVARSAAPGVLWDDASNAWVVGPIT